MSETDERKPTYEELLEEKQKRERFRKQDRVFTAFLVSVVMQLPLMILAKGALAYIPYYLASIKVETVWMPLTNTAVILMWYCISAYLVWHFVFVFMCEYEDEIRAWCRKHNFLSERAVN